MILVTGAAGKTGQAVIKSLLSRKVRVRAFVRRIAQEKPLRQLGVDDFVVGDLSDKRALDQAFSGVNTVYHICPNMHPDERFIGELVIRAAQRAGIKRFVYHSVLHPQIEAMPHHWQKMRVEEQLFESGLAYTILQPAAYMQNVLANWERIVNEGVFEVPYRLDTRLSMVDLWDVAEAAAAVIVEAGHEGATYELSGSEALSQYEAALAMSEVLGRQVTGVVIPLERWEKQARSTGLSSYALQTLLSMFQYYEQNNFWGNSNVLGWLLGRSPTNFTRFLGRSIDRTEVA